MINNIKEIMKVSQINEKLIYEDQINSNTWIRSFFYISLKASTRLKL